MISDISSCLENEHQTKLASKRSWPLRMDIPLSVYALLTSTITAYLFKILTQDGKQAWSYFFSLYPESMPDLTLCYFVQLTT